MELRRLNQYRLGLIYLLASLMQLFQAADAYYNVEKDEKEIEACYQALAGLVPPELTLQQGNL